MAWNTNLRSSVLKADQGTVINGVRSAKYPGICCMGIVISASCDIANQKISKVYYLTALNVKDWFCSEAGYREAYMERVNDKCKVFMKSCEDNNLNYDIIMNIDAEEVETILKEEGMKKNKFDDFMKKYKECCIFYGSDKTLSSRLSAVRHDQKTGKDFLLEVERGRRLHYFFLPEQAYKENGELWQGLIVDIQEINWLAIDDVKRIDQPGIDAMILDEYPEDEQERLKKIFWLEQDNEGDYPYVYYDGKIISPWREHLMQRFSSCFTRIGLDGPAEDSYERLMSTI